jgi:dephospho-CoA kinase
MEQEPGVKKKLGEYFGPDVYEKGKLNRSWLASRIFDNEKDRLFVNSVVHPAVQNDFRQWTTLHGNESYVIKEAALLYETGVYKELDKVILVTAPLKLRIERIMKRDGLKQREVKARMASQIHQDEAVKMADHLIINDETSFVLPQVIEIHQKFQSGL